MGRISMGWRLTQSSWVVFRGDRSLALFPVLSFVSAVTAFVVFAAPGAGIAGATGTNWVGIPFLLAGSYAATFAAVYFNVALAGAARRAMDGHAVTLRDGLEVARDRRGLIADWALLQWAVGLVLQLLQDDDEDSPVGRTVGTIVAGMLGAAWGVATFFVVPVLAFEGVGPGAAVKRSTALIRGNWGEGFVGNGAIGLAVVLIGGVPAAGLIAIGATSLDTDPAVAGPALVLGILGAVAVCVVSSALGVIFRVALYRYATEGTRTRGFAAGDLASAFLPEPR